MTIDQGELLGELATLAAATLTRIEALAAPLTDAQLHWRPPDGGWSVGDVLEHLCIAEESYLRQLDAALPPAGAPPSSARWSPRLAGRFLTRALRAPRRLPAPKSFRPPAVPRAAVLEEYLARARTVGALIERARGAELRRVTIVSPISRLLRMNAGDALSIVAWHARRHLGQMQRVRHAEAFPAAPFFG